MADPLAHQLTFDELAATANAKTMPEPSGPLADGTLCWRSPGQAAARTPLSRKAIYGAIRRRELRASKRCGRWMIRESDLDRWIANGVPEREDPEPAAPSRPVRKQRPEAGSLAALRAIEASADASRSDTLPTGSRRRRT